PGTISNEIFAHEDMMPTLLAAVGDPDVKEKLLKGMDVGGTTYKVHLDGYNILPYLKGDETQSPRKEFMYWTDDGDLAALRYNNWKVLFMEQRAHGFDVWQDPFVVLRFPKLENLRMDPFERAEHEAIGYGQWRAERMFALVPAQAFVANWISSFKEFPPRQKAASFSVDQALQTLENPKTP
ncbi:MAG: arylsulfatase, partial [Methyloceanibacter sp.]